MPAASGQAGAAGRSAVRACTVRRTTHPVSQVPGRYSDDTVPPTVQRMPSVPQAPE